MTKTMLQIIDTSNLGGAEKHTRLITKQFAKMGYKIFFIYPPGPYTSEYQSLTEYGVKCLETDFRKNMFSLFFLIVKIRSIIKKEKIRYIHSHQYLADFIAALGAIGFHNVKHFSTIHFVLKNLNASFFRKIKIYIFAFIALKKINFIFTVSRDVKKITEKYFFLKKSKVFTTLNSIDPDELTNDQFDIDHLRAHIDPTQKKTILLCASILYRSKGQEYLIRAVGEYLRSEDLVLILLSEGSDKNYYLDLIKKLNISDRVLFPGYQKNSALWIETSDIYIHPSIFDPLPRSLLEAMYLERPIIASKIATISEVIEDNISGLLVEPSSPKLIADAILKLNNDKNFSVKLGKNARIFVKQNCLMESMAKKIIKITTT